MQPEARRQIGDMAREQLRVGEALASTPQVGDVARNQLRVGTQTPSSRGIDRALLAAIHKGIAEVYRSENARISADPLADEVARIYDDLVAAYDTPDERLTGLKLMLHQLRRDLRATPAVGDGTSKQAS